MEQLCQKIHVQSSAQPQVTSYSFGLSQSPEKSQAATTTQLCPGNGSDKTHPDCVFQNNPSSKCWKGGKIDFRGLFLFRASRRCSMFVSLEKPLQYMGTIRASGSLKILPNKTSFPTCKQRTPTLLIHSALQIH